MKSFFWTVVSFMASALMILGGGALIVIVAVLAICAHWGFAALFIVPCLWMALCDKLLEYAVNQA
jgi:hypothetical protein